jgi:hypothetical protein
MAQLARETDTTSPESRSTLVRLNVTGWHEAKSDRSRSATWEPTRSGRRKGPSSVICEGTPARADQSYCMRQFSTTPFASGTGMTSVVISSCHAFRPNLLKARRDRWCLERVEPELQVELAMLD